MSASKYEYRIVDKDGDPHDWCSSLRRARWLVKWCDRSWPGDAPHRIERREAGPWERVR